MGNATSSVKYGELLDCAPWCCNGQQLERCVTLRQCASEVYWPDALFTVRSSGAFTLPQNGIFFSVQLTLG
jgi:hypothetical protein